MYIFSYLLDYWIIYEKIIKSLICWSHLDSYRRVFVCLFLFVCFFFLQDFWNLILKIHTLAAHMHFQWTISTWKEEKPCSPRTKEISMPTARIELATLRFSGWNVRFSCSIRRVVSSILASGTKISLSRANMVSPPSKLKMFTGSVCVLLTSVSLKLTKIKITLIYATTSSWEKKQNGGWKLRDTDWFYFSFYNPSCFFLWSESSCILFLFFY